MWRKFLLVGMLAGCFVQPALSAVQIDGVAAHVNGHVITVSDVLGSSSALQEQLRDGRSGQAANALFQKVLDELIDRKLIVDAYDQQREIQIPPIMIDERVQEVIQELFRDDRNAFLRALGEEGRSERSWREEIREQVVVRAMRNLRVDRHIRVSPTEVRARYEQNPALYVRPKMVTYRMLVLDADAATEAGAALIGEVHAALAAGEDFGVVTSRYSVDRFAEQGGLRESVNPGQLREEVRLPLLRMDVGQVEGPITLGPNQIWLALVAQTAAQTVSLADVYDEIEMGLFRERAEVLYRGWLERLRSAAYIAIAIEEPF